MRQLIVTLEEETKVWESPDQTTNSPNAFFKAFGTNIVVPTPSSSGRVSATFDNVVIRDGSNNIHFQDDFSSNILSGNNWASYESVREIEGGKLRMKFRAKDFTSPTGITLSFNQSEKINEYQTKISLSEYQPSNGANPQANIMGFFFNETGNASSGYEGEIYAAIRLGGPGLNPNALWAVGRFLDTSGNNIQVIQTGEFSTPIALGEVYTLYLKWDGIEFTFKIRNSIGDEETASYIPPLNRFPSNIKQKRMEVRILPPAPYVAYDSFVSATFDDVSIPSGGTVKLPQTGQTICYGTTGNVIPCAGTGQDGDLKAGVPWPIPRFIVSGECIADKLTGLMWARNGSPSTSSNFQTALDYTASLNSGPGLCGHQDWRLPNVNELESLANASQPDTSVWLKTQGFGDVYSQEYWSSTYRFYHPTDAWSVGLWQGNVWRRDKNSVDYLFILRGINRNKMTEKGNKAGGITKRVSKEQVFFIRTN